MRPAESLPEASALIPRLLSPLETRLVHVLTAPSPHESSATAVAAQDARAGGDGAGPAPTGPVATRTDAVGLVAPADDLATLSAAAGPELLDALTRRPVADLGDAALDEAVVASERLISHLAALQADVVAEKQRRAGSRHEFVRDEVAALLRLTGRAADVLTTRAYAFVDLPELHSALAAGALDTRRVDTFLRATDHLSAREARSLLQNLLPDAERMTTGQMHRAIRRLDLARDPAAAEKRHAKAVGERRVVFEPAPDAMGWIHALLPAADAAVVRTAVDALAHRQDPADERTRDQRRADALTGAMRSVLDRGTAPDGTPLPSPQGRRPHLTVFASPDLLVPGALGVGELEGYGPIPGSVVRQVAADAAWQVVGVDPRTGELAGAPSRAYRPTTHDTPQAARPVGTERDARPAPPPAPAPAPTPPTPTAPAAPTSHPPESGEPAIERSATGGPPADRPVTDLLDRRYRPSSLASAAYRPSPALIAAILGRDRTCTFPGCLQPAIRCDIDHIEPFDPDRPAVEQTRYDNLHALCRRHHRLKTHGGWQVSRDAATGITTWISPAGRVHTRLPEVADRPVQGASASGSDPQQPQEPDHLTPYAIDNPVPPQSDGSPPPRSDSSPPPSPPPGSPPPPPPPHGSPTRPPHGSPPPPPHGSPHPPPGDSAPPF